MLHKDSSFSVTVSSCTLQPCLRPDPPSPFPERGGAWEGWLGTSREVAVSCASGDAGDVAVPFLLFLRQCSYGSQTPHREALLVTRVMLGPTWPPKPGDAGWPQTAGLMLLVMLLMWELLGFKLWMLVMLSP